MPLQATGPACVVNVPGDFFYMAGFEVTLYGRFWLTPEVQGYTGTTTSGYTSYRNFTANDVKNSMDIIRAQVHELGNSLHDITTAANNDKIFVKNPGRLRDSDAGAKLEKCIREHNGFKY